MKRFVEGEDRSQSTLFPERLEDYISEDYRLHREPQGHWPPPCDDFEPAETGMTGVGRAWMTK
jgi:hypothetical protein